MTPVARPIAGEDDLPTILALLRACEANDQVGDLTSLADLRDDFLVEEPGWRHAAAVWDGSAGLAAVAQLWAPDDRSHHDSVIGWCNVHPDARAHALPDAVLGWIIAAARAHATPETRLEIGARSTVPWRIALLERAGLHLVRRFDRMKRDLTAPIPDAPLAPGYTIRTLAGPNDLPGWVAAFNGAFVDHYGFVPETVDRRAGDLERPGYDPTLDFIAVAPDGTIAAFCQCNVRTTEEGAAKHVVDLVGTRRDHRRRGLALALLTHALRALRERGAREAHLAVDQESETRATALYERAGFIPYDSSLVYSRRVTEL